MLLRKKRDCGGTANSCCCTYAYIQIETAYKAVQLVSQTDTELVERIHAFRVLTCLLVLLLRSVEMCTQTKAAALMANIPQADIDPSGVFKYILIRVHSKEEGDDSEVDIVRGYGWAEYHADIYDKVSEELEKDGHLDCECIGGGRIRHDSQAKKIHVYGYSMGFGRANHALTTEKLKARYPDYEVTWDNEGY